MTFSTVFEILYDLLLIHVVVVMTRTEVSLLEVFVLPRRIFLLRHFFDYLWFFFIVDISDFVHS